METLNLISLPEPQLEFKYGQTLVYPRDGLYLYGPVDGGRPDVHYGAIGTKSGVERLGRWAKAIAGFVNIPPPRKGAKAVEPQHIPFPGFSAAFNSNWPLQPKTVIDTIDSRTLHEALRISNRNEAIKAAVDLYVNALVARCDRIEDAPSFWFVIIPEEVYDLGRPLSRIPTKEKIQGKTRMSKAEALKLDKQPTLFGIEEAEADVYKYATHFRRQLKARLLSPKIVTQIVRETTLTPDDFLRSDGQRKRRIEDDATVAWKLATGSYYKAGGRPWQLAGVREGVCYVGLAYKRREATADDGFACCAAQMFLSSGEGVVFRGALGPWYNSDTKQFHIDEPAAKRLIEMVVQEYRDQHDNKPPRELFLHAKSNFSDEEWTGFVSGAPPETNVVGVQISDAHDALKLFRPGKYPVMRGTALLLSDSDAYVWTSGYVPRLDTYLGPETPNPVLVRRQRGNCELRTILEDVMSLTKINFNSCLHNDRLPVTIRFADAVGEVILAAPQTSEPKLAFKYYI
ncbi:argonaute/piwi family protein [Bradyrhizobium sp. DASA03068]|uniref:argonaute/piwi family protein n=1 Tax=Bradyrhizobium sp. BLXBL-01 TaxID=3395915 RepID=UPI003F7167B1